MNDIFGVPTLAIMVVLIGLLALCLLIVIWIAWRRTVIFKLGVRNIPRRRAETILIVIGLMLSTMIVSAALGTGDTLDYSFNSDIYDNLGHVDELVVASRNGEAKVDLTADTAFADSSFTTVETAVLGDANVDGLMPMLDTHAPVSNGATNLAEPDVVLTGLDPTRLDAFGGLRSIDGQNIDAAALTSGGVVLSDTLADDLDAMPGDQITVYIGEQAVDLSVIAVAEDSYLSGLRRSRTTDLETAGMALSLAGLQQLTGKPGQISAIAVSNVGGARDGVAATDEVVTKLRSALTGEVLGVDPIKQDRVERGESISNVFTGVFLVLGLFSVAAGVLLIVLIFTMLAAERRPEMGMARAVGAHRGQLIQQFVSEGAGYAILAGLLGSALGVLATYGIGAGMNAIFGDFVPIEPHITSRSLIIAYCLGVFITFLSVAGSSWKISRLNIVAAVRDIPDAISLKRRRRTLLWGLILLAAGGLMTALGTSSGKSIFFMTGVSMLPFGVAMILRFFGVTGRAVMTTVSLFLLIFWLLPEKQFERIFGSYDGNIEMFFVSGIFLVIAATILIVNNLDVLLEGVNRIGGVLHGQLPAIRTAIAYPGAAKGRTGLTIAMFSLIVFSIVMMASMNSNFSNLLLGDEANAGWEVRADALGAQPFTNFEGELQARDVDTSGFNAVGVTREPNASVSDVRLVGNDDQAWTRYPVLGMDGAFIDHSRLTFGQRAAGYESDAAILDALRTQPDVVIADASAVPEEGDLGGGDDDAFTLTGLSSNDKVFDPIEVELVNPNDGNTHVVTVIGILDSEISSLYGLFAAQPTIDRIYGQTASTSYYVDLEDPDRASAVAKEIEAAMLTSGVQGISIADELEDSQRQANGFLYIIEGFMGLGLVVGIAAVGVIAFRSVVERRQQIGVLRAIGFQRSAVATSFLIETAFLVGLGGFAGTMLGLILARNLFTSEDVGSSDATFLIPWTVLAVIFVLTNIMALVTTWIPARQASRVAPAEALRYE